MFNMIAVPYTYYPETERIIQFLRETFDIKLFNKSTLTLVDSQDNKFVLVNHPEKVRGYEFKGIQECPGIEYSLELQQAIRQRIRN